MINVFACGLFDATGCEESIWVFIYTFLVPTLFATGIGLAVISFLMSAISFITSAGDTKATEEAVEKFKGSAIGLGIILLSSLIIYILINALSPDMIGNISEGILK